MRVRDYGSDSVTSHVPSRLESRLYLQKNGETTSRIRRGKNDPLICLVLSETKVQSSSPYQLLSGHALTGQFLSEKCNGQTPTTVAGARREDRQGNGKGKSTRCGKRWEICPGGGEGNWEGKLCKSLKDRKGFGYMTIRDLLGNELFTVAVLRFLRSTDEGTVKEGVVLDKE